MRNDPANTIAPWEILTVDLASSEVPKVVAVLPRTVTGVDRPEVSGDRVVWLSHFPAAWELWETQIGSAPVNLASGEDGYQSAEQLRYRRQVTYDAGNQIHLVDVTNLRSDRVIGSARDESDHGRPLRVLDRL